MSSKLEKYLDSKKEQWATMLSYIVDKDVNNPIELAETHLKIIINEIIKFINTENDK